jgi:FixJ family two-component response regulator
MPGISGLELQDRLTDGGFYLPVIVVSGYANVPMGVRAMKSGAVTVLEKPCREEELWDAIREALALDTKRHQEVTKQRELKGRLASLSSKECEVMNLLLKGHPHKHIAQKLDVSERTVEGRRKRILEKTQSNSLVELARIVCEVAVDKHFGIPPEG